MTTIKKKKGFKNILRYIKMVVCTNNCNKLLMYCLPVNVFESYCQVTCLSKAKILT